MSISRTRAALAVFFLVGFGVPWAATIAARLRHISFPYTSPAFVIGAAFCNVAGVLATYMEGGSSGLKGLARRCVIYRVSVVWWVYALFLPPGGHVLATLLLCGSSPARSNQADESVPSVVDVVRVGIRPLSGPIG